MREHEHESPPGERDAGAPGVGDRARMVLGELAALARLEKPPEQFWPLFLTKLLESLGAYGGTLWQRLGEDAWHRTLSLGKLPPELAPVEDSTAASHAATSHAAADPLAGDAADATAEDDDGPRPDEWASGAAHRVPGASPAESAAEQHLSLLTHVFSDEEPCVVPPRVAAPSLAAKASDELHGNPTEFLLMLCPLRGTPEFSGMLEIYQRRGTNASGQRLLLGILHGAGQIAEGFLRERHYRALAEREALAGPWEQLQRELHGSLEPLKVCFDLAAGAKRLVSCDRASVALMKRGKARLQAISGQPSFDRRASRVQRLETLIQRAVATGEPFVFRGQPLDLAPRLSTALNEYLDVGEAVSLAIVPLRRPARAAATEERQPPRPVMGALVLETFDNHELRWADDRSSETSPSPLVRHAELALGNALAHDELFLMPLWRTLGKSRVLVEARHSSKTTLIAAAILVTLLVLVLYPARFELEGRGVLQPVSRRELFAGVDGEITSVRVRHGQRVTAGELLCELQNPDLDVQLESIEGQRNATADKLRSIQQSLLGESKLNEYERTRLHGDRAAAQQELLSLQRQLNLLEAKREKLQLRSPIDGLVVTWDAEELLLRRPVKRGDALLSVVDPTGEWELEVRLPENRMGHVENSRATLGAERPVGFVLATDPGRVYEGAVREVQDRAEVHGDEGNVVLVRVAIDKERLASLRPGAEVTAKIACGRRPLIFVWLHDVFDFVRAKILFRYF